MYNVLLCYLVYITFYNKAEQHLIALLPGVYYVDPAYT